MLRFFKRRNALFHIIHILKIEHGLHHYPHLTFTYKLDSDILTLVLPSKHQYLFSPFEEPLTIIFNSSTNAVNVSPDPYGVATTGKLLRHLKKCFKFIETREEFMRTIHKMTDERRKISEDIEKTNRQLASRKRNKDSSMVRDFIYAAADDSSRDDSSNDDSGRNDSSSHHDNS